MARKSRYQSTEQAPTTHTPLTKVGIYARLSVRDGEETSESITNQIWFAKEFLSFEPTLFFEKTYINDGYTGLHFDRPGFQEMMEDAKSGLIKCILVKDISRIGRNYLSVGQLLLETLPKMGIRFISINDYYDSSKSNDKRALRLILQSIVDQKVSTDTSKRVSSAIDAKKKAGDFLPPSGSIPYGYLRDEKNSTYTIDDDAFLVVKRIYHLRAQGYNISAICRELNERDIPSPSKLRYLRHETTSEKSKDALWSRATVRKILSDQNYIGNRVHGKKKKSDPTAIKQRTSEDEWIIIENAHPAIISRALFEQVQAINGAESRKPTQTPKLAYKDTQPNILQGKVFCGDCGRAMKTAKGGSTGAVYYNCSNYKESGGLRCTNHYISEAGILTAITQEVEQLIEKEILPGHYERIITNFRKRLAKIEADMRTLSVKQDGLFKNLMDIHEAYSGCRILRNDAQQKSASLRIERTACEVQERILITEKAETEKHLQKFIQVVEALHDYQHSHILARKHIETMVDRIYIFHNQRIQVRYLVTDFSAYK